MGNCLRSEKSSMVWAGDDWGSLERSKTKTHRNRLHFGVDDHDTTTLESLRLLHEITASSSSSSLRKASNCREVKIKITKKELDHLLGRASGGPMQGLSVEQFLSHLLNNGGGDLHRHSFGGLMEHQRSWRPGLQSIPEVN